MPTYIINETCHYYQKTGGDAGTLQKGTLITLTGVTKWIRETTMYEMDAPIVGKYIEMKYLSIYDEPPTQPPEPPNEGDTVTFQPGDLQLVANGVTYQNIEIVTLTKADG